MSLPSVLKTWQYNVNNAITAQGSAIADNRRLLRLIKDALKGFGSGAWTVRGSSNGVSANMAGTDLWAADSDIVFVPTTGVHSWIVLRQLGMGAAGVEILIDLIAGSSAANAGGYGATIRIASVQDGGFTGGTTSVAPTAVNQQTLNTGDFSTLTTDLATRWNVMQSTDGASTRVWVYAAGTLRYVWIIDAPVNKVSAWNDAFIAAAFTGSTATTANSYGYTFWKSVINDTLAGIALSTEGTASGGLSSEAFCGAIPSDLTAEYVMLPAGICCNTTGVRGRHGVVNDLWYSSSGTLQGDTYPGSGAATFVNIGPWIFPWNGGSVNLT